MLVDWDKIEEEIISGSDSADINIDWSRFSNFSHFGSIKKRVENFKYKCCAAPII